MIKSWFKKYFKKLIIATSIITACIGGAFGISKSYAYEYDSGSNQLVGNNLLALGMANYCFLSSDTSNILNSTLTQSENITITKQGTNFIIDFTDTTVINGFNYLCIYFDYSWLNQHITSGKYYNYGFAIQSVNFTKSSYYLTSMNCYFNKANYYGNQFNFASHSRFNLSYFVGSNTYYY